MATILQPLRVGSGPRTLVTPAQAQLTSHGTRVEALLRSLPVLETKALPPKKTNYTSVTVNEVRAAFMTKESSAVTTTTERWSEHVITSGQRVVPPRLSGLDSPPEVVAEGLARFLGRLEQATPTMRRAIKPVLPSVLAELRGAKIHANSNGFEASGATVSFIGSADKTVTMFVTQSRPGQVFRDTSHQFTVAKDGTLKAAIGATSLTESPSIDGVSHIERSTYRSRPLTPTKLEREVSGFVTDYEKKAGAAVK